MQDPPEIRNWVWTPEPPNLNRPRQLEKTLMEQQNVGMAERGVRIVGSLAALLGIVLLVSGKASLASGAVGTMLASTGLYLFVSGYTGDCLIYRHHSRDMRHVQEKHDYAPLNRWRSSPSSGEHRRPWVMLLWCLFMMAAVAWIVLKVWNT